MNKLVVLFAAAVSVFSGGCCAGKAEKPPVYEPWKTSKHFKKIVHSSGVVSYLLDTDISHNQQAFYFTTREMTNDGRFLVFAKVEKEIPGRDYTNMHRTIAVLDFARDEIFETDIKTLRGRHGIYVDPEYSKIYSMDNVEGLHCLDLAKGERKSKLVCPMPDEIKKMGKEFYYYCTHLTLSKDNKKAFLDIQCGDIFTQGVLNVEEGTFTKWGNTKFYANHGQFNPQNPDMAMCAWEIDWVDSKGKLHHIRDHKELYYPRLWLLESNGKQTMIPSVTNYATHEVWCRDGKGFIFCSTNNNQGVIYHDLATGLQRQIMKPVWLPGEGRAATASHADITADNRYIVCDIGAGCHVGYPWRMAFGNTQNGKYTLIYNDGVVYTPVNGNKSLFHPHPHPHFIYNDKVIVSTFMTEVEKMSILLTPVDQLADKVS